MDDRPVGAPPPVEPLSRPRSSLRARVAGLLALAGSVGLVVAVAVLGQGARDASFEFDSPGVWLTTTGNGEKITHIALATGAPDARIDLGSTFPAGFVTAADDRLTVLRASGEPCHLDRLDEARLNLAKRNPRLDLGAGPCERYRIAVGGGRVYVVDDTTGEVRQFDGPALRPSDVTVAVPAGVTDLEVDPDGLLVTISGVGGRELRAVRDGETVRRSTLDGPAQIVRAGDRLALVDTGGVGWLDAGGGTRWRVGLDDVLLDRGIPDHPGRRLAVRVADDQLVVVDPDSEGPLASTAAPGTGPAVLAGDTLYVLGADGAVRVGADGATREPLVAPLRASTAASPDDTYQAVATHDRLWVHHPDRSRGWMCEPDGGCRAFEKNSRTVPETAATPPEQPDPPRTIPPTSASTVGRSSTTTTPRESADDPSARSTTTTVTAPATTTSRPPAVVTAPGPVTDLVATGLDGGAALRWSPPRTGSAPDRYHVQVVGRAEERETPVTGRDGAVGATVGGLSNGTEYQLDVWASVGGVEGARVRRSVLPSTRTPSEVRASVSADELCASEGRPGDCAEGREADRVLVVWADSPGVTGYRAGCDVNGAAAGTTAAATEGVGRAVVRVPPPAIALCWVEADGGSRTYALAPVAVTGVPEVSVTVGSTWAGEAHVQASISGLGGWFTGASVDGVATPIGDDGRLDLSSFPSGEYLVRISAANDRGSTETSGTPVTISPGPVTDLAERPPRDGCCTVTVSWSRVTDDDAGYELGLDGLTTPTCAPTCTVFSDQTGSVPLAFGTHRDVWATVVASLAPDPGAPLSSFVFDVAVTVTVRVRVTGSPAPEATLALAVRPATGTVLGASARLHPDETLDGAGAIDVPDSAADALCAVRSGADVTAVAVRLADTRTGWVAPADVPGAAADLPDCRT